MITKEQLKAQIDQLPDEEVQGAYQVLRSKLRIESSAIKATGSQLVMGKKRRSLIQRFIAWLLGKIPKHQDRNLALHDFKGRFDKEDIRTKAYE